MRNFPEVKVWETCIILLHRCSSAKIKERTGLYDRYASIVARALLHVYFDRVVIVSMTNFFDEDGLLYKYENTSVGLQVPPGTAETSVEYFAYTSVENANNTESAVDWVRCKSILDRKQYIDDNHIVQTKSIQRHEDAWKYDIQLPKNLQPCRDAFLNAQNVLIDVQRPLAIN